IRKVRELAPELDLEAVTFATGSAAIQPSQAEELTSLGRAMSAIISERPGEVFLIEGHTDAVGSATYNLALSDRRAETVALALSEYFDVPPENMITQGYGESALKIPTLDAERANRRATIRRITPLLRQAVLDN
ncbi:MAG: OmpA family protein, partial [Silicimonas sp.]|nr:OmpA family protein [Silicimonas sp.]